LQVAQLQKINSPSQKWPVKPINIFETNLLKIVFHLKSGRRFGNDFSGIPQST
jgi:hypothetical protein